MDEAKEPSNENEISQMSIVAQQNDYYKNCNIPNLINKWKRKNPWLFLKEGKLFCKACIDYKAINKFGSHLKNKFSNEGITNITSSTVSHHTQSEVHLAAVRAATLSVAETTFKDELSASTTQKSLVVKQNDFNLNCNVLNLANKWRRRYPWLFHKEGRLFCQACIDHKAINKSFWYTRNQFCNNGATTIRSSTIIEHARSQTHLTAVRAATKQQKPKPVIQDDDSHGQEHNQTSGGVICNAPPPPAVDCTDSSASPTEMSAVAQQNDYYRNCNVPNMVNKWRKRHPWLYLNDGKMFCQACLDFKAVAKNNGWGDNKRNKFSNGGSTSFQSRSIEAHSQSEIHLLAVRSNGSIKAEVLEQDEREQGQETASDDEIYLKEESEEGEMSVKQEIVDEEEVCFKQEAAEEEHNISGPFLCQPLPDSIKEEIVEEISIKEEPLDEENNPAPLSPPPKKHQKPQKRTLPTLPINPLPSLFNGPLTSKFSLKINYNSLKFKLPPKRKSIEKLHDHLPEKTVKEEIKEEITIKEEI